MIVEVLSMNNFAILYLDTETIQQDSITFNFYTQKEVYYIHENRVQQNLYK